MSARIQRLRDTAAFLATFTGRAGEIIADMTNKRLQLHDGVTAGGIAALNAGDIVGRNIIINGNFNVNQRGYASGGALASAGFGHDRWRDVLNGTSTKYTFTQGVVDTVITITGGQLGQPIAPENVYSSAMWFSWTGTAKISVQQGANNENLLVNNSAGTQVNVGGETRNAVLVTNIPVGVAMQVSFSSGTLDRVQMEAAIPYCGPTKFERRFNEVLLCQRYYQRWNPPPLRGICSSTTYLSRMGMVLPVTMRANPTATMIGQLSVYNGNAGGKVTSLGSNYCLPTTCEVDFNIPSSLGYTAPQFVLVYQNYDNAYLDLGAEL